LGVCGVCLKAIGIQRFGIPWICRASARSAVPIEEDVDFVVELAGADVFVEEIGVGNLARSRAIRDPAMERCRPRETQRPRRGALAACVNDIGADQTEVVDVETGDLKFGGENRTGRMAGRIQELLDLR